MLKEAKGENGIEHFSIIFSSENAVKFRPATDRKIGIVNIFFFSSTKDVCHIVGEMWLC